jgi:hypothetical protein
LVWELGKEFLESEENEDIIEMIIIMVEGTETDWI